MMSIAERSAWIIVMRLVALGVEGGEDLADHLLLGQRLRRGPLRVDREAEEHGDGEGENDEDMSSAHDITGGHLVTVLGLGAFWASPASPAVSYANPTSR
jgi:hypothetical protein